jgi:hypothetical protein
MKCRLSIVVIGGRRPRAAFSKPPGTAASRLPNAAVSRPVPRAGSPASGTEDRRPEPSPALRSLPLARHNAKRERAPGKNCVSYLQGMGVGHSAMISGSRARRKSQASGKTNRRTQEPMPGSLYQCRRHFCLSQWAFGPRIVMKAREGRRKRLPHMCRSR